MVGAEPVIHHRRWLSPVWLLPMLALLLAVGFLYQQYQQATELVRINFEQGNGILPNKTQIRYQGVMIGMVTEMDLADDGQRVAVLAKINHRAKPLIRKGSQFWLVSPKASLTEISGLDTIVSGNYINLNPGPTGAKLQNEFDAIDGPPPGYQTEGRLLQLITDNLDSVNVGTKLFFRGLEVGRVINTHLQADNRSLLIDLVIEPRFSHLVKAESRFWNISGIKASFGSGGLKVESGSLGAILGGGIEFDSPPHSKPVTGKQTFTLYKSLSAAERGVVIKLHANELQLKENMPILYQGIEIGRVLPIELTEQGVKTQALLSPDQAYRITNKSHLSLEGVSFSANGLENADRLLTGPALRLEYRPGEQTKEILVRRQKSILGQQIVLVTTDLNGLQAGAPIWFKGVVIGQIDDLILNRRGETRVVLTIAENYRPLLQGARFYKASPVSIEADLSGVKVDTAPLPGWIGGGIKLVKSDGKRIDRLYPSEELALLATINDQERHIDLYADSVEGIGVGTPLLYRGLNAGKVTSLTPKGEQIKIGIKVEPTYAALIGKTSLFWKRAAVETKIGFDGVKIKTSSLAAMIQGGIEFNNFPSLQRDSSRLYADKSEALDGGRVFTLIAKENLGLSEGAPIRYLGVDIGRITKVTLNHHLDSVHYQADIFAPYAARFLVEGASYQLVKAKLGLGGVANAETLIKGSYVVALPGRGQKIEQFTLNSTAPQGVKFWLTAKSLNGIAVGSPLLFKQMVVGQVETVKLAHDGSAVLIQVGVESEYAHLVRKNSRFWNGSGIKAELGFTGVSVDVATVESLLAGGIVFNTPEREYGAAVKSGDYYSLHAEPEDQWLKWQPKIAP